MERRRKTSYIRSTNDPNIFRLSFMDKGHRVILKMRFEDFFEASDWLEEKETEAEKRKWNGN